MAKITFIGAGSLVFTHNLCSDILLAHALQDSTICLMDIDPKRLAQAQEAVQAMVDKRGLPARVEATLDQREAIRGAGYVITTFQQGGLDAFHLDIEIPQKYGVEQGIGDTLGPGGVFRGLRTIPVMQQICSDMEELAPNALLINYVNPMAIISLSVLRSSDRPFVGLCHSVQGTSMMLAEWAGVPYEEVQYLCAGINHMAFMLEFRRGEEDLYPRIRAAAERPEIFGLEPVRTQIMKHFGYFVTESSAHASEYNPYFRKTARMVNEDLSPLFVGDEGSWHDNARTGGYLRDCIKRYEESQKGISELEMDAEWLPTGRTHEFGSFIIEAMETNRPIKINGNVLNRGLITNLPQGCCVEVPCLVDANGIQPTVVGDLPVQLAALIRTNVNVQEITVEASLTGNRDLVYNAVMMDPLTSAVCTLPQIHDMVSEMLAAQECWLPQFKH